jgi:hypothetical protein
MFWRDKPGKKYYYNIVMKMINSYLFPICKQDLQVKMQGDIYLKTS